MCDANGVAELYSHCLIRRFSVAKQPAAVAVHGRRRILYVANACRIQAFEITSPGMRVSPWLVADCAAVAETLLGNCDNRADLPWRAVGVNKSLRKRLVADAAMGVGSAAFDSALFGDYTFSVQRALRRKDQAEFSDFYALGLGCAKTRVEARLYAKGLAAADAISSRRERYVGPVTRFNLHLRHTLRAFDAGALWAIVYTARLALNRAGSLLRSPARRVLRVAHARGDDIGAQTLACNLLWSLESGEQSEGFGILLNLAQVSRHLLSLLP